MFMCGFCIYRLLRNITLYFCLPFHLKDPEGSEVAMLEKTNYTGIITFPDFRISSNPKYGLWTIKAKYKEDFTTTGTTYFEIKNYGLFLEKPYFFILVEPESNFISHKNFEDLKITIKARYSYKNVTKAEVSVIFGIKTDFDDSRKEIMHGATQTVQLIDGVTQINFNTSKAIKNLSYKSLEDLNNKYLNIFVTVQESTGEFFSVTNVTDVKYVLSPYTLHLIATPVFLKPGIPYSIKVQVKDPVGHFVGGIAVTLKAKTIDNTQKKTDLELRKSTTNYHDGIVSFVIDIPTGVTALEFHVRTDDPDLPEEYQASSDYQAVAYSSHSQSFLSLSWTDGYRSLVVGEHLNIIVTPKSPYVDKITHYSYLISSKGKIVYFGTEKRLPGSSYQYLNLSVTQHMAPIAHLLVYYIVKEGKAAEIVSDSICLNIEEKCGNQLQIHLSPNKDIYSPGEAISLVVETHSESQVALSAVDSGIQGRSENPMERVLQALDKSDQDCGASGGRNNAEVFYLAGLTVLTNAIADDSQHNDGSFKKLLRSRRQLKEKIEELASKFKHPVIRKCCHHGAYPSEDSCEQRTSRITIGAKCAKAFLQCCTLAKELRDESSHVYSIVGRLETYMISVASNNFRENWLWEVYHVPNRYQLELVLPDFLTTWKIQGIGISDKGLCVVDKLQLQVCKNHFLVINHNATSVN
ncbi:complement C5 [Tupaia chinensis]|uniref:complement C5 n=1 Tax=Tupaia chinensis TaxID=246437 RepID=UPI000FFC3598|nr:complement C5 [Tupaia chinensis]